MSFVTKLSSAASAQISKYAAKTSKLINRGVKIVEKNGAETVTTFSKTETKVRTYKDSPMKIIEYGKNSDANSIYGLNRVTVIPKNSKTGKEGMVIAENNLGMTQSYSLKEFGDWMKFLRNYKQKNNLNKVM